MVQEKLESNRRESLLTEAFSLIMRMTDEQIKAVLERMAQENG